MYQIGDKVVHPMYGAGTGDYLSEGTKGHQLDNAHVGGIAHLISGGEHGPGILAVILHPQGDLLLRPRLRTASVIPAP